MDLESGDNPEERAAAGGGGGGDPSSMPGSDAEREGGSLQEGGPMSGANREGSVAPAAAPGGLTGGGEGGLMAEGEREREGGVHDYGRFGRGDDEGAAEGGFKGGNKTMSGAGARGGASGASGGASGGVHSSKGGAPDPVELGHRAGEAMRGDQAVSRGEASGGEGGGGRSGDDAMRASPAAACAAHR